MAPKNTECSHAPLACDLERFDIAYGLYLEYLTWRRKYNGPFCFLIDEKVSLVEERALRNDLAWVCLRATLEEERALRNDLEWARLRNMA